MTTIEDIRKLHEEILKLNGEIVEELKKQQEIIWKSIELELEIKNLYEKEN